MNLIRKMTASAALVALVSGLFTTGVSAASNSEIEAANKLAKVGIINDHSANTASYELNRNVLRQEIAATARGIAKVEKATTYEKMFNDVTATTPNTWAWKSVNALRKAGLIASNDNFRPEANITKAESIGMVVKACYGNEYNYDSAKEGSWQKQVVAFANNKGMVDTFSDYNTLATRGFVFKAAANCVEEKTTEVNPDEIICQLLGTCTDKETPKEETKKEETKKENNVVSGEDVLMVELSPETPKDGNIAAGAARAKMLGFDVTAGKSDVTLKTIDLKFTGLGDSKYISDLAVYDGLQKVTKGNKKFQSDDTADLSFEKDIVIKAGETKTLFVTATIAKEASNYNQTLQVTLTDLEATSTVKGDDLVGSTLTPILVKNVGAVELKSVNVIKNTINVGEVATLAEFTLDETSDKEDVNVKSITMELDGSFDSDDLDDLTLYADGTKIDATFTVKNSELEIELNQKIEQDKKVKFQLKGSVSGSVNDDIKMSFEADAIYVVGDSSEVSISVVTADKKLAEIKIEGSEINIAFNRESRDEAKPGADDVKLASVDLSAASDYTIKELTFTVKNTDSTSPKNIKDIIKALELDNTTYDKVTGENTTTAVYTFEDIDLSAGKAKKLPLTIDLVNKTEINGADLEITMNVVKVKDEDNNKTYTNSTSPKLSTILSNNSFTAKTLEVKSASMEIASVEVNDTKLVLGNGVKTVLYKGKISIGDADSIVLSDLNFVKSTAYTASVDVDDIVSDATLNIGGKTFKGDVETNKIEFNNINATIAAGADNVEVLVVATLKDNDSVANGSVIGFQLDTATIDADDTEGDTVLASAITTTNANNNLTKTTLNDKGTFSVATTASGDNKDKMKDVVLAGSNSVNLGEVEIQADQEDADIKRLTFVVSGTAETSATAAAGALTATTATTTAGSTTTTTSNEKTKLTVTTAPTVTGPITVTINGQNYTANVLDTDSAAQTATKIKNAIGAYAQSTDTNVVVVVNTGSTTNYADATVNVGSTKAVVQTVVLQQGGVVTGPTAEVKTITMSRALVSGDVVTYNGTNYTSLAALATAIQAQADVATATVNGNIITVTGQNTGAAVNISAITTTPYAGSSAGSTTNVDYSSTFKNVKLMEGSKVLADNATLTYVGGKTYITFKDFKLAASNTNLDAMLVADLAKFTTSGSETSATLGKFTIVPYTGTDKNYLEVKGVSSQETYAGSNLTVTTNNTKEVSIVPAILKISVNHKLGKDDRNAQITFNIDKGNNTLDNNDVKVTEVKFADDVTKLTVRDDDGTDIFGPDADTASKVANVTDTTISNGDKFEFVKKLATYGEIRIAKNGVSYTVDGNTYNSYNDDIIDLGTYSN